MQRQTQQQQIVQQQQQQQVVQQQQQQQFSQQRISRTEQHVTRQVTQQQQVQGMVVQGSLQPFLPADAAPPVFEQIFRNARFAQGGNAHFQGKLRGNPKPQVSWTRKGAPLFESAKYKMQYEQQTGNVSLLIKNIGPGDEGEYTCTARNQYGEAICSVFISPEGVVMPQGQQSFQQTQRTEKISYTNGTNGHTVFEEDFKVDTFEYRLIREVSFRETVTRRFVNEVDSQMSTTIERSLGPPSAPQIAQKPRNSKLQEGSDAVFSVKIAANPKPRLTWFKNGQRLVGSQKHQTSFSNQQATLKIAQTNASDTGHYTLLAENPQGVVVSSAYLAVEPKPVQDFIDQRETTQRMTQIETTEAVDSSKMLAPNFVRVCTDRDVTEGKMTRFDCRVTGRPYPEVAWFINGRQVADDATHKILVNESGNHSLMITSVNRFDHGTVTCVARNKAGETSFQCNLNVIEKEQVVAPKFVERFSTVTVKEGEPVTLSVRAVGTPIPRISWQKDGVPVMPSADVNVSVDGGASILDLPAARSSDAGWYQCMAQNVAGSTATRARLYVQTPAQPEYQGDRRLHLPRPTRVIEPEPQPGPEIIYLRHVERAKPHTPHPEEDRIYPPPHFIIPLAPTSQVEGGRIHFEARIEPVGDPTMRVEWFHNGRPLSASSRATTTFKFGFIALDLLSIVQADAGEYTCRVTSSTGSTESRATLTVTVRASIEQTSQHPESLQYISNLEDYSRYQRTESMEEIHAQKPAFIRPLHDLGQLNEGRNAHFEGQLTPVSDPTMKVEWYKDGHPITASSRITSIFNFGYVSLNILHLRAEDSGSYTVRAVNRWGEAISTSNLTVIVRSTVTGDLGIPEQQRYIEQVEQLEAYQTQQHVRTKLEPPESTAPPVFKSPIKDQLNIREGGFAHFEARLEPIGDSTLKVEWLKDGRPVEASSRITTFFNFGYVALTIKYVTIHDVGIYTCRAYNTLGQAETTAQMSVITKQDVIFDSQHPTGLQKIQHLEDSSRYSRTAQEEVQVTQKPRFLGPLKGTNKIVEGQRAHFEARVEPQSDPTMKIEWYFNGKVIMTANRTQTYHDFGYVALDILSVRAEDAGTYTVVARNALGEAQLSASMVVETRASIDTSSMHHGSYEKTKRLETGKFVEPQYEIEEISKSKPIFVTPLTDPKPVSEGKNIHLECRLEPMGDPTMRVEWFHNGRSVTVGSRFRTYYDFGFVALDIIHATSMDTGEYTVRAVNHLGSAHTSAQVRVISHSDILTDTQNEAALEQIQFLEDASRHRRTIGDEEVIMTAPQFTRPLHNLETIEGTNIHLECRLQPVGDSTMRVEWFVNGRPVKTGHRFRPAYDFDYVALDLLSVYPVDSGVYTCQARNALGEAVTSCSVKIHAKKDLLLESQHPGGLEKIHYLEDSSRYRRTEQVDETITVKPRFVTKPKSLGNMREGQHAHFECKLEPVTDSNLKVEWYKNGRPITVGHRFRPIHDFGYVALDIVDLIAEDSGTYTCRAVNLIGADETSCALDCKSSLQILTGTQNETGLEQIQYLEDRSKYQRSEVVEETTTQAPTFTTSLKHVNIKEGQRAHFECRLIPVSDATMKVEWFHNNVPLKSGSRFTETNNFGFVALDILHCLPEDSGTYTCRAKNIIGEAVTSGNLNVQSKKSIYLETQHEGALQRLHQLEDTSRHQRRSVADEMVSQAPVFTQPVRDLRTAENQAAHFEARLIPVGDARLKVEWLRNGVPIQASNRVTTMHDFGYVALNMKYVYPEDSGSYTCRAVNDIGEAVTSATLDVQSKESLLLESQHKQALQKIQMLEDSTKYQRREEVETVVTQAPKFTVQLNGPTDLVEGQSAHYECRIEPYPDNNLKVEWLFNGKPLQTGHRFRTTYDFGFAALDVLTVYGEDSGEYTCRATNKLGQAQSSVKLNVKPKSSIILDTQHEGALQKIQYLEDESRYKRTSAEDIAIAEKPQFGRPLKNIEHLPEGQSAHLEATLTPVNDPTMKVEWYCNGRPIPQGHRFKTTYDFGFVALDILYAYPEDSGTYMCKARNAVGEAVTTCSVNIDSKSGLQLDTLDEQRLQKIRDLENYQRPEKVETEPVGQKPVFITPLNSLSALKEGDHAHLECRVEPINDPNMKIEWFVNGVAIRAGHRFRTTHDFGYVALDVLYTWGEDTGTYMCKATNLLGEAINTTTINVQSRRSVYLDTQHPEGLEKIRELEAQGHPTRLEIDEPIPTPPKFITELRGTTEVLEGATAHFECQVEPLHDSNLRIEFFHNGKPLPSASRFHITFDFGYVALDIGHCVPEDAGEYSVKAVNKLGQCTSSIKLKVISKGSIILDSQRPEGLEKIRQLEEAQPFQRPEVPEPVTRQRPVFTQPLQNIDSIPEGTTAHFECRLIPVGDPTLKVEWFRNEKPLEDSSRITKTHDFGFVSLDLTHVRGEDDGVYMCRASNALGEAVTTASMKIRTKADIQLDTLHKEGMRKIQQLEAKAPTREDEPERAFDKPIFTQLLTGPSELWEGQHAHFECRVVPVGDPTMRFEWFVNGVELKMGSRFRTTHDFGFVTLDIMSTVQEDSGVYTCKAINKAGEAVSSAALKVKPKSTIMGEPLQPDAWQKIQLKEAELNKVPPMFVDTTPQQAPVFTSHLQSMDKLVEGQHVYLEAQVEPRTDPNLRIEWFKNGLSLTTGARLKSTFDFGLVTLSINSLRADDSAIYTCKATNLLGEAVSTCTLKIEDKHWLLGKPLRPEALPLIEALEEQKPKKYEAVEPVYESPVFISHLNNVECKEGDNVHFECHVEPSKDPTMKIEWFVNGKPLPSGSRYKSTYDFGYVSLDINHSYAEDSGIYMCKATNSKGHASTSGSLRCTGDKDIYLDTQHPQGPAGLEKVQEVDDLVAGKLQRQPSAPEATFPKPVWTIPFNPEFHLGEAQPLHLEGTVEPKTDPNLKIEWFFNGKALEHGSRFKMTSDFGFVTLDLTEVYERDQGIYTCKASNQSGEAFTSTTIYCTSKTGLIERTQHPKGEEGLEKIQSLEESLRRQEAGLPESELGQPPVFTSQFSNQKNLSEGEIAHFEASLTPVGDETMVVEWFYNGKALEASHRTRTVHAFGMVVLEILGTKIEDSGIYSCRATNKWGRAEITVELECVDKSKGQKPHFTTQIQSVDGLKDGDSAHFECTLIPVGDPLMKVEWFHNGKPLRHSTRIKGVSDFGFVLLDIAYTQSHDSGEYVCKASNKYGEDYTKATVRCVGKGGVYLDTLQPDSLARIRELELGQGGQGQVPTSPVLEPPVFHTQIRDVANLKEGQSAHFEARLTPVHDPDLVVEWYFNGKKLPHGHRYRTFHDFGIVILDILYCYEENSGVYECRAVNKVGQDSTKATLKCGSKAGLILESQLPQGMEGGLEKIQNLEEGMVRTRDEKATEERGQAPMFTVPLANIDSLREGESAHFEGRLTPTNDPRLKVEWFWNGKPLRTGSRFRTFCDFGFVILEISPVYPEDSGEYSCRATNEYGEAVTTASMKVQGKRSIILESQLPKGMESTIDKIAELEGLGQAPAALTPEADSGKPPEFITTPSDLTLAENQLAHFECRLMPVNDPSMRVEWFHNGKSLWAGSRVKTINDFGFVILEIAGCYIRESGLYTCKATNKHGEASVSCKLQVHGRQGIIMEPQLPSNFRSGTESLQKLEESLYKREEIQSDSEQPNPPKFIVELKDVESIEAAPAHFDCRVEPVSDSSMRIDWFFNGRPFATGSRVHMLNDFGFIVLDMDYVYSRDEGEYICRATNKWGTATTKAKLTCKAKHDVVLDSQLPQGMSGEKLKELERGHLPDASPEDKLPAEPPRFITQIESVGVGEAEPVHFECRVEPKKDPTLRIEWYRNGKLLPTGHRYRSLFDLGYVSLDILYVYPEDAGEYVCKAINDYGEDFTKATVSCKKIPMIILQSQVPKGMKRSEALMQMEATIKKYTSEVHLTEDDLYEPEKKQPPRFVTQIEDQTTLVEMQSTKFECQLAPVGDPNMKVEWFLNGKPLSHKNRFTPIYDFGYVAMNFGWVYPEDSGEYLCRATNLYGMDETRAVIKTSGKPGIIYDSQLPKGMKSIEKIREIEAAWQVLPEKPDDEEKPKEKPIFVTKPEPFVTVEGDCARFCCRVTGFPRPRVMWLINGHTVVNGMRYRLTYDGMWHLDIPKTRQYDHGKVEVVARNSSGETRVETLLTVNPRGDDYRGVLKNSPRPWYDAELGSYQAERQEGELARVFEERAQQDKDIILEHVKPKSVKDEAPEWTQVAKSKRGDEYYSKLRELEEEQVIKEARLREASHQFAIPGEKVVQKSLARGMADSYETNIEKQEELMPWQKGVALKKVERGDEKEEDVVHQINKALRQTRVDDTQQTTQQTTQQQQRVGARPPPDPTQSAVHGKEVHVSTQKQTQKEVKGDKEITRKISATERTEVEHKGKVEERVVQGQVQPSKPPFFTKKIQPCRAFEQEQARFEVEFDGDPLPTVKWFREDFPIQNSPDFQIHTFSTKSILIIRQVFMEDSGVFAAVAENRGGRAKCSANLVVQERRQPGRGGVVPPSFVTTTQSTAVKAGQLARFDARIAGTKPLDVHWLKNGKKITPDIRYKTLEEDNTFTLLIIETVPEDGGQYECVAINSAGEARCEAECVIQAPSSRVPAKIPAKSPTDQAPTIIQPLNDQTMKEGQPVLFKCKISGKPAPQVKWMKGNEVIKPSKYFQMSKEGDVYSLRISEAFPEDEGVYKCVASNPGGQVTLSGTLSVLAPDSQEVAPTLSKMADVTVLEGSPAQFRTQMAGKPTPTVQWFREGALIPQSPDFQMINEGTTAVLLIASTYEEDSGTFTCKVTNSAGQAQVSAKLIVKRRPAATQSTSVPDAAGGKKVATKGVPGAKGQAPDSESELSYSEEGTTSDEPSEGIEGFLPEGDESLPWRKPRRTERTAPWRRGSRARDRSLDSQLEKQPRWKRPSRDRSLDTQQLDTHKKVIPWTQESIQLKKPSSDNKEKVERKKVQEVKLRPMRKVSKDDIEQEIKIPEDLTTEKNVKPWIEEGVQLKKVTVDKKTLEKEKLEEVQLKPARKLSKDVEVMERKPSVDSTSDKKITPWTQEEIKLRKISVDKKQPEKEKLEEIQLKPTKTAKDIDTPGRKYSLDTAPSEKKVVPWTEEAGKLKKVSVDKIQLEREKLEEVILKPTRKLSSAGELEKKPSDVPLADKESVPWTQEKVKLKKVSLDKSQPEKEHAVDIKSKPLKPSDGRLEDQLDTILLSDESYQTDETKEISDDLLKTQQAIKLRRAKQHIGSVLKTAAQKDSEFFEGIESLKETDDSELTPIKSKEYSDDNMQRIRMKSDNENVVSEIHPQEYLQQKELSDDTTKSSRLPWKKDISKIENKLSDVLEASKKPDEFIETQVPEIPLGQKKKLPWTEETIKLKKTSTQKSLVLKEELEDVMLKPFKYEDQEEGKKTEADVMQEDKTMIKIKYKKKPLKKESLEEPLVELTKPIGIKPEKTDVTVAKVELQTGSSTIISQESKVPEEEKFESTTKPTKKQVKFIPEPTIELLEPLTTSEEQVDIKVSDAIAIESKVVKKGIMKKTQKQDVQENVDFDIEVKDVFKQKIETEVSPIELSEKPTLPWRKNKHPKEEFTPKDLQIKLALPETVDNTLTDTKSEDYPQKREKVVSVIETSSVENKDIKEEKVFSGTVVQKDEIKSDEEYSKTPWGKRKPQKISASDSVHIKEQKLNEISSDTITKENKTDDEKPGDTFDEPLKKPQDDDTKTPWGTKIKRQQPIESLQVKDKSKELSEGSEIQRDVKETKKTELPWRKKKTVESTETPITDEDQIKPIYEDKPKSVQEKPEDQKLVMGKGKFPEPDDTPEEVHLKKIPKKQSDDKPDDKEVPKKLVKDKPIDSVPDSEETYKLKPLKDLPTGEGPEEILPEQEKEGKPKEDKPSDVKDKKKLLKGVKPEQPEEHNLELGKGKKPPGEEDKDISLKKMQGLPKEELPEEIKLKPWKKDKPDEDKEDKGPFVGKPKPFDRKEDDEEIPRPSFDDTPEGLKKKTKTKVKRPKDGKPLSADDQDAPEEDILPDELPESDRPDTAVKEDSQKQLDDVISSQPEDQSSLPPWRRRIPKQKKEIDVHETPTDKKEETPKKLKQIDSKDEEVEIKDSKRDSIDDKSVMETKQKIKKPMDEKLFLSDTKDSPHDDKLPKEYEEGDKLDKVGIREVPEQTDDITPSHLEEKSTLPPWRMHKPKKKEALVKKDIPSDKEVETFEASKPIHGRDEEDFKADKSDDRIDEFKGDIKPKFKTQNEENLNVADKKYTHEVDNLSKEVEDINKQDTLGVVQESLEQPVDVIPGKPEDQSSLPPWRRRTPKKREQIPETEKPLAKEVKVPEEPQIRKVKKKPEKDIKGEEETTFERPEESMSVSKPEDTGKPQLQKNERKEIEEEKEQPPEGDRPSDVKEKKKRPKGVKPYQPEEEHELELGKGKKPSEEEAKDISLKTKQELPKEELPEEIKLKPWKKDKPHEDKEDKGPSIGKPKPFEQKEDDEEIPMPSFDDTPEGLKKKRKTKVKRPKDDKPLSFDDQDAPEEDILPESDTVAKEDSQKQPDDVIASQPEEQSTLPPWRRQKPKKKEQSPETKTPVNEEEKAPEKPKMKKVKKKPEKDVKGEEETTLEQPEELLHLSKPKDTGKLQLQKIERKEIKPSKLIITPVDESPLFASIKLKKAPSRPKKEIESVKIPKVMLKSRIQHLKYPPKEQFPMFSDLEPVYVDNGILSRNYEEAKTVKKTKRRRVKLPEIEKPVLEPYIPFKDEPKEPVGEEEESRKQPKEKKPKVVPEKPEDQKLVMGKGKLPGPDDAPEDVHLKTIPKKQPVDKPDDKEVPKKLVKDPVIPLPFLDITFLTEHNGAPGWHRQHATTPQPV